MTSEMEVRRMALKEQLGDLRDRMRQDHMWIYDLIKKPPPDGYYAIPLLVGSWRLLPYWKNPAESDVSALAI